jgi:dipeptidyl-peptidase III
MASEVAGSSSTAELAQYVVSAAPTGVAALEASDAFASLTEREALYALALSQAAWGAGPIVLLQTSPESVPIFQLLRLVFDRGVAAARIAALSASVSDSDWMLFLKYAATFIENCGNYLSFGDTKFVPGLPAAEFERIVAACVDGSDKV